MVLYDMQWGGGGGGGSRIVWANSPDLICQGNRCQSRERNKDLLSLLFHFRSHYIVNNRQKQDLFDI